MSDLFEKLQPQVTRSVIGKFSKSFPNDTHDAAQEALIRLWKDVNDGLTDEKHLYNRAMSWARAFLTDDHHPATGTPPRSRDGLGRAGGQEKRDKILSYIDSCNHRPTNKEISEATGITMASVQAHRTKIERGMGVIKFQTRNDDGSNRLDRSSYQEITIHRTDSAAISGGDTGGDSVHAAAERAAGYVFFEDDIVNNEAVLSCLNKLPDELKSVVYQHIWLDKPQHEIGTDMGTWQATVGRRLAKAYALLKPILEEQRCAV